MTQKKRNAWVMSVVSAMLALLICLGCMFIPNNSNAKAQAYSLAYGLHKETKIYSRNFSKDYYLGCEDYANYTSIDPSITVFTPGLGCSPSAFSNDEQFQFAYNQNSIIAAICRKLNNNVDIYYAKCNSNEDLHNFVLYKIDVYDYKLTDERITARIADISKHIILLFDSSIKDESNQKVYNQFEYVVDSVSLQYKQLAGVLPLLNLVGHSRGGLTNIQYATEHPYNVASVFSMGTPYSGSTLGQIDAILQMLDYVDENGDYSSMGAKDIMTPEIELQIRDNWNAAYNHYLDANFNVVALGAMTSLSMARAFAHDLLNYKKYKDTAEDWMNFIEFIISNLEEHPIYAPITLIIVNCLAEIVSCFGKDLMVVVGDIIDNDVLKSITNDELKEISALVNIINDEVVIMDDLFIDTNSQLGYGFDDEKCYDGFKRFVKIYTADDIYTPKSKNQPAVVHNIETMNSTFVHMISDSLTYGVSQNEITNLSDMTESVIGAKQSTSFYFAPEYTGTRKLNINSSFIKLYEYTDTNCLNYLDTFSDELDYEFKSSHRYLITTEYDNSLKMSYKFTIGSKLQANKNNDVVFEGGDSNIYVLEAEESGYYNVNTSSSYVTVEQGAECNFGNYYFVYLQAGKQYLIVLNNSFSEKVNANIEIVAPKEVTLKDIGTISVDDKLVSFTNPYNTSVRFKLTIVSSEESGSASVYDKDNSSIATVVTSANTKNIYFTLGTQEQCFIVFSHADNSISAQIGVDEQQLRWKINNTLYASERVRLPRGESYDIQLVLCVDGQNIDTYDAYVTTSRDEFFIFTGTKLQITYKAVLEYDIVIVPMSTPEYILTITVDRGREDFKYTINLDKQGGEGDTDEIIVYKDEALPDVEAPRRLGYTFKGYYSETYGKGTQYYDESMQCVSNWDKDLGEEKTATIYAHWEQNTYKLVFDNGDKSDLRYYRYTMVYDQRMPERAFAPTREGYTFVGYFTEQNGKGEMYYAGIVYNNEDSASLFGYNKYYVEGMSICYGYEFWSRESDLTLYAHWEILTCKYFLQISIEGGGSKQATELDLVHGKKEEVTAPTYSNLEFKYFSDGIDTYKTKTYDWEPKLIRSVSTGKIVPKDGLVAVYSKKECVISGTLITLADGKQVPVENLTGNEKLLAWNLLTGQFDVAPILFIDKEPAGVYKVIKLTFSDGTDVGVISEHGFWDFDLNKYVYLDSDAAQYIGHWFNKQITNPDGSMTWTKVQLVNVEIREEYTTAWSPVTYGHLCYYVNGMLSMPGGIGGLFNIFEVDSETLKYDEIAMQADIEKYGLFTYEEFADILPVPIEMFDAVNGQYLKVAIGKGLIDIETLERLVSRYADFFVTQ